MYRTRDFALLAGVTVRALHHYDRLKLLCPRRTPSGYRAYSDRDLERLEQIVALKFIGLPLAKIRTVLDCNTPELADVLRQQCRALEENRRRLDQLIEGIREGESALRAGRNGSAGSGWTSSLM